MADGSTEMLDDDAGDEVGLYLERLAQALLRLGIIEMEGVVVDGSEVAGAIMALDAQLTAGWQLAEAVRLANEAEARLNAVDASVDPDAWAAASRDHRGADQAVSDALLEWDACAGLHDEDADAPVSAP